MTADELTSMTLAELRRDFFDGKSEKAFFHDRPLLLQAIAYPARYFKEAGAAAGGSKYRAILRKVIGAIKEHGNRGAINSFGRYFLHAVQEHLRHHGADYIAEAKEPRALSSLLDGAVQEIVNRDAIEVTATLAAAHRALSIRSGRKRRQAAAPAAEQPGLF